MKKEKWKTFVTDRWKVAAPGLLAAFAVCFIFFIYAPLELYVTNQTEFWFDFYKILKAVLQNFALFFGLNVLGILLAACISKVFCRFVTAAELVVLLTLYVQGNFLVNHMPPFDGTEIVWEDYRGENIKTAIVCILIAAAVVTVAKLLGAKRFQGICMAVSAGLSGILMITLVTMTVTTGAYRERTTYYALENGQYRLSQDQNFLVLLLDAVDAKTFEEVMDSDPAYTETFADFTYYPIWWEHIPGRRFLFRISYRANGMKEKNIIWITRRQLWMNQDCSGNCLRGIMTSHCMSLIRG